MAKRKVNLPLIEVLIISIVLHGAALLILGGITIYQYIQPPEPELEAPPVVERAEPERLQQQVRVQQQQRQSTRPTQRITVTNVSEMNMPTLDIDLPQVATRVGVGGVGQGGQGGGGLRSTLGSGSIDFNRSAVNFFGIRSQGERIMFIIDASRLMMLDKRGGIPAYNIIKEEIIKQVSGLSPGTLFNVMFYNDTAIQAFSPTMVPATAANKEALAKWIEPINKDFASVAKLKGNVNIKDQSIEPMKNEVRYWPRALQVAMEQGCDAIFIMTSWWGWYRKGMSESELQRWYKQQGWGEKEETAWQEAVVKARAWLQKENEARRSRGQPERVIGSIAEIVREISPGVRTKPAPSWSRDEVMNQVQNASRALYANSGERPPVNVVLYLGADEKAEGNSTVEAFQNLARRMRGRFNVLQGLPALRNVTGKGAS